MAEEKVVLVEKPEDWLEATAVKGEVVINTPRGAAKFQLRAISFGEWNEIQQLCPEPEVPKRRRGMNEVPDPEDPDYQRAVMDNFFKQLVGAIDLSWQKLPGATLEDKERWVRENMMKEGQVYALHGKIMELSGRGTGQPENESSAEPMALASPEDWSKLSQMPNYYSFVRNGERRKFTVKSVSSMDMKAIEVKCDPGKPPIRPQPLPDGRRSIPMPSPNDPNYLAKKRRLLIIKQVLVLDASLSFKLFGTTPEEKLDWLNKRPAGEVQSLIMYTNADNQGYGEQADFFTGA